MCDELCHECWARRFCGHCFAHVVEDGRLDRERKLGACEKTKTNLEQAFRRFVYIWENEPLDLPPELFENTLHAAVARANERAMQDAGL